MKEAVGVEATARSLARPTTSTSRRPAIDKGTFVDAR